MKIKPIIGQPLEPIAELTTLWWTVMSAGSESNLSNVYATRTSSADCQELCRLDVLDLEYREEGDQQVIYELIRACDTANPEYERSVRDRFAMGTYGRAGYGRADENLLWTYWAPKIKILEKVKNIDFNFENQN
jgi:hypothetical protein